MNKTEFIALLKDSTPISPSQTNHLDALIDEYPYFQAARALHLKGLKHKRSFSYNKALKIAAAHTIDRSILFEYITSPNFTQHDISDHISSQEKFLENIRVNEYEDISASKTMDVDDAVKMRSIESEQVLNPALFERKEFVHKKDNIDIGAPLEFNPDEEFSFSEWLTLTKAEPIDRSHEDQQAKDDLDLPEEKQTKTESKFDLIDAFIEKKPKIKPQKQSLLVNIAEDRVLPAESLMTETLARVYLEQNNYKKAIQAYKILGLKNPEKSGFFADRIREIEQLKKNKA
ncbi:tetratricopeptide repeat protein [Gangjinia marincola]|uniref:Tetratricopeptide repeat protein n=1 Tax=Gangjinia marincola TaxID=578463 RepID=A0ABP3XQX7_9FLAO